jgi:hypothetical protein
MLGKFHKDRETWGTSKGAGKGFRNEQGFSLGANGAD